MLLQACLFDLPFDLNLKRNAGRTWHRGRQLESLMVYNNYILLLVVNVIQWFTSCLIGMGNRKWAEHVCIEDLDHAS